MAMFIGPDTIPDTRLFCHFSTLPSSYPAFYFILFTLDLMKMIYPHPSVCSALSFRTGSHSNSRRFCDTPLYLSSVWSSFQYSMLASCEMATRSVYSYICSYFVNYTYIYT
ncbi:hypothetical protein BDV10DRAFT_165116 [Aspergillus recurvatus]